MKRHIDRAIEPDPLAGERGNAPSSSSSRIPLAQAIGNNPIQARQRQLIDSVNRSPRMQQQRQQFQGRAAADAPAPVQLKTGIDQPHGAVAQLTPDEALGRVPTPLNKTKKYEEVAQTLANVRRFSQTYSNITRDSESFKALKAGMRKVLDEFMEVKFQPKGKKTPATAPRDFIKTWNEGTNKHSAEYYVSGKSGVDYRQKPPKPMVGPDGMASYLTKWQAKANSAKMMTPDRKMAAMLPMILAAPDLPPKVKVALKLFFTHTANFVPTDRQGRDFRSVEHGQYYRSSLTPPRAVNSQNLKRDAHEMHAANQDPVPARKTYQVINKELHDALLAYGKMGSNIEGMTFIGESSDEDLSYAEYTSSGGSHTGSLGLIQNIYRTLMVGDKVEKDENGAEFGGKGADQWKEAPVKADLRPVVPEHKLAPATERNYHDLLIADRNALVTDTAKAIKAMYSSSDGVLKIAPIQSDTHASLILEIIYPPGTDESKKLTEAEWRHTFISAFNKAAKDAKLETRLTHRGSFGFLHPTASSVGGPVRIWPGLTPPAVFKSLILGALKQLPGIKKVTTSLPKAEPRKNPVAFPVPLKPTSPPAKTPSSAPAKKGMPAPAPATKTPALHIEALKSAVRYAQDVMRDTLKIKGPEKMVEWIAVRLKKNLSKAAYLLDNHAKTDAASEEREYIKASSVIENLMEYSYMLEAFRADAAPAHDPYPEHLRRQLALDSSATARQSHTFYLDSGMQAIVAAHLLARNWGEQSKKIKSGANLISLDMNTYFEYAAIDKTNLQLQAANRAKTGHLDETDVKKFFKTGKRPHIISADLNPVLTTNQAKKKLVSPQWVLGHFAGNHKGGVNKTTIPIIDITNATLQAAADLRLGDGYRNFIIVESLSKHHQLGADKYTMGRLNAVGTKEFVALAKKLIGPIAAKAHHALPAAYRLRMDRVFYGERDDARLAASFVAGAGKYDAFMDGSEQAKEWRAVRKSAAARQKSQAASSGKKDELLADYRQMKTLLGQALDRFAQDLAKEKNKKERYKKYGKRHASLPSGEQRDLQHLWNEPKALPKKDADLLPDWFAPPGNGITNVGNTCYLAAALNTIAFSPYRALFAPRHPDPKAALRAMVHAILVKAQASEHVGYDQMVGLLSALDHARLLEEPNAFAAARPLNAQRDPSEVMSYLLAYFGVHEPAAAADYRLSQTGSKTIAADAVAVPDGDPERYSDVDAHNRFADQTIADWLIKLPMSGAGLATAIARYQALENLDEISGVKNGAVVKGRGTSQWRFGGETPRVVTVQLLRWELTENGIEKQTRAFDMPETFVLNNFHYDLKTIIHHHGEDAQGGHYTANVKNADAWEHRDDDDVTPELHIAQRRKEGYIYTYERGAPAPHANAGFIVGPPAADPGPAPDREDGPSKKRGRKGKPKAAPKTSSTSAATSTSGKEDSSSAEGKPARKKPKSQETGETPGTRHAKRRRSQRLSAKKAGADNSSSSEGMPARKRAKRNSKGKKDKRGSGQE